MSDFSVRSMFRGDDPAAADPAALADRRELALIAVERTRMPMVMTDPRREDNPIVWANQAFLDLTGYTAKEVIGRNCRFLQGPETAPLHIDAIRQGVAQREHFLTVELLNYRKNGTSFWNQLCISPVHDENGVLIYHFASQQDIGARRYADELEAVQRLLLKEVDHRSMNALAIVNGIVRLSKADTAEGYASAISGRVDAIARAHRILSESQWRGSDIRELIDAAKPPEFADRFAIEGPPVILPAPIVQSVALIFHELISNAIEHGALSADVGTVGISWPEPRDGRLHLEWKEYGAPVIGAEPSPGFGLQIIKGLVEQQLRGVTSVTWKDDGLTASAIIPLNR